MEGYINGKPDISWWTDQIMAGIAFRKKLTHQGNWDKWRAFYRGNWKPGIMPKNLFFTMVRTVVPRIYFRNPSVSITARVPGQIYQAGAQVLERVDNTLIRTMRLKEQMKRIVQHGFMFGTGVGKLGFGAEFTPTPDVLGTVAPRKKGFTNEYRSGIVANMPWFSAVHPGDFIVPADSPDYHSARWVAHWIKRPVADVRDDKRLKNVTGLTSSTPGVRAWDSPVPGVNRPTPMIDLVEIRDKQAKRVMIIAPFLSGDKALLDQPDELQGVWGPPFYPVSFNADDQFFWGVPDSHILEPYQLELNETNTQIRLHRTMSVVKILYENGAIKETELDKLMSGDLTAVEVNDILKIHELQGLDIPRDLFVAKDNTMADIREAVGFSRNQFGEYKPGSGDTTATEAQIVKMASEIRVDERRDMMADMLTAVVQDMHRIVLTEWNEEQVMEITGPMGVPVWVKFRGTELGRGSYHVKVDPDTAIPETKSLREQKAVSVYSLLKENPLIDPVGLTQYLLHELHGVQFDSMIRIPGLADNEGTQENPLSLGQFGQVNQEVGRIIQNRGAANA